jgi:hypothetical protein
MSEGKKKDWAAISDDEDEESEEETSPVREPENNDQESQEPVPAPEDEPEEAYEEKTEAAPQTEDQKKLEMINQINNANLPRVHLNIFNVRPDITEQDLLDFYQPLHIDRVFKPNSKTPMFDLEFYNKEDALKILEKGAGVIRNCRFQIRVSLRTLKPDTYKQYDKRPQGGRNYDQNRPYNKDRNYQPRDKGYGDKGYGDKGYGDKGYGGGNKGYYDKPYEKRGEGGARRDDRGDRGDRGNQGGDRKRPENKYYREQQQPPREQPKKEEDNKEPELPKEWQKAWEQRDQGGSQKQEEPERRPQGQGQGQGGNKYQEKNNYYRKKEETKEEIQMKGRGQTKYGKEDNLEQDKILQGGSKGNYRRDRNEEGGEPKRNNYYKDDKWSKEGGGNQYYKQGGKYEEGAPKMNSKQGSRNFEEKQYYVKKNTSDGKEPGDTTLTKRSSFVKSQNTVNPFDLLPQ